MIDTKIDTKFAHLINSADGLANETVIQELLGGNYTIIQGLDVILNHDFNITISPGLALTLFPVSIVTLTEQYTVNLINIDPKVTYDGHHVLMLYNTGDKLHKQYQLRLSIENNNNEWSIIYDDIIVLSILEVQNGQIINQLDKYKQWSRNSAKNSRIFRILDEPNNTFDSNKGYRNGDIIVNNSSIFLCANDTPEHAQWIKVSGNATDLVLGTPPDGSYNDGLFNFQSDTSISQAIDSINEVLKHLAPSKPQPLHGNLQWSSALPAAYISDGLSLNVLSPGVLVKTTRNNTIIGFTPNPGNCFDQADKGTLQLVISDDIKDSIDLQQHFDESRRDSCQLTPYTSPNRMITITKVCCYNNFPLWQIGNAKVTITENSPTDDKIVLRHITSDIHSTDEETIFFDLEQHRPVISNIETQLKHENYKYLSGVKYLTQDTIINVKCRIDYLFEYCYVSKPVTIQSAGLFKEISYNDSSLNVHNPPMYNDVVNLDQDFTLSVSNQTQYKLPITIKAKDQWGVVEKTDNKEYLVNTFITTISNTSDEYFCDETYRLPDNYNFDDYADSYVNQWDSTQPLHDGQAQVIGNGLIKPHDNYTNVLPGQNVDYSSFTKDAVYYRAFYDPNPHSHSTLILQGITQSDIGNTVEVYVKLPTQTGWLSLQKDFIASSFSGEDNDGARTYMEQEGENVLIHWTSGTFNTAYSGYRVYIKIVIKSVDTIVKSIHMQW